MAYVGGVALVLLGETIFIDV